MEHLCSVVSSEITKLEGEMHCSIVAVVSDGASNMTGVRERLADAHPHVLTYRCQAHALHLAASDLFKDASRSKLLSQIVAVLKTFKNSNALSIALQRAHINRPPLPCEVRWCSHRVSLACYNKNWAFLAQFAAQHLPPSNVARQTLETAQVSRGALDLLLQLQPISEALALMQQSQTTLGEALCIWPELLTRMPKGPGLQFVKSRFEQARCGLFAAAMIQRRAPNSVNI